MCGTVLQFHISADAEVCNQQLSCIFTDCSDHNHPTSPLLAKPPELSEEVKLPPSMKFVAANTVGE